MRAAGKRGEIGKNMNPQKSDHENSLARWQEELLSPDIVMEKARSSGFLKRMRKLNPTYLLLVLVFGISSHSKPSVEEIYRRYIDFDDDLDYPKKMCYQSFSSRINENMVSFLREMLDYYIERTSSNSSAKLKGSVELLKDILIQDSSIIRLSKKLAEELPAVRTRTDAAGIKLHAVYSAVSHSLKSFEITDEKTHDSTKIKIDKNIKDILFLFDLGYYSHSLLAEIAKNDGFFVSRVKKTAKPKVEKIVSKSSLLEKQFGKGISLNDFLARIPKKGNIELECTFTTRHKKKGNKTKISYESFRVVCFWDETELIWHNYVTNLPDAAYNAEEIYQLYRYRWIIELLFKELKSDYDLGKLLLAKKPLVCVHVYSILIRLVLSRNLYKTIISPIDKSDQRHYGPLLWSKVFTEKASEFLSILQQTIFGKESVAERWNKLELSLRHLSRSRHNGYNRISLKYISF